MIRAEFAFGAEQLFGDIETGPWVHIITMMEPGYTADVHCHSEDEVIYIVQGTMIMGSKRCGPGTLVFMEKGTVYGFTAGDEGVRFLNFRPGKEGFSAIHYAGEASEAFKE